MTTREAKEIPLEIVLEDLGIDPARRKGNSVFYFAREGDKKTPSFKIDIEKNMWYDHGVGVGGNTIDAVIFLKNWDFHTAMKYLSKFESYIGVSYQSEKIFNKEKEYESSKKYELKEIKKIFSYPLKNYIDERGIDNDIADKYLKEILYDITDIETGEIKEYYALGFKNNSDGWEIRNKFIKGNLNGKDITTINNNSSDLKIFEGAWDFLSYITLNPEEELSSNFIILNSTALVKKLNNLEQYKNIECYFDNDDTGQKTYKVIYDKYTDKNVIDCSYMYENYNDLNKWLQDNKNSIKQKRGL